MSMRRLTTGYLAFGALACAITVMLPACATNPATGEREFSLMSEAQEIQLGKEMDPEVRQQMGVYEDANLQRYVSTIGLRLAQASERPQLPWQFTVVDEPAVNAFALPGGYIYITRGILAYLHDEEQLAGVLGHEIGHVTARHSAQQYTQQASAGIGLTLLGIFVPEARPFQGLAETAFGLLFLKHGRDDELQADRLGVEYAARGGWDPKGVAGMLRTLQRLDEASGSRRGVPNFLSTHPAPGDRVEQVLTFIERNPIPVATSGRGPNLAEYQRQIDGIVFGDSPSDGIVRGNEFLHPDLRIALQFPGGWEIQNSPQQVAAKAPNADHFMVLQLVPNPSGSIQQIAQSTMANAGFRPIEGERTTINGLDAYVGTYQGTAQNVGNVVSVAAHIVHNRNVYLFAGLAPADQFRSVQAQFANSIRTFRELSARQAASIRPNRVEIYTVRSGDTWDGISRRGGGLVKPETLAIMNNYEPNQPPRAGDRIKVVVEG